MEEYYSSIFNEVFGPIMIGTSSSHTAGPYRIGATARMLLGEEVKKARISFDPNSSYGSYYKLQWSDRGFTAGLFGGRIDSEDMTDALTIAKEKGMDIQFIKEPKENKHANYAYIELEGKDGGKLTLDTTSVGGGAIEIIGVDGFSVSIKGDFNSVFLYSDGNVDAKVLEEQIKSVISETFHLKETKTNEAVLYYLETREYMDKPKLQKLLDIPGVVKVRYAEHVLPVLSSFYYENMPFRTAAGALEYGKADKLSAGELGIRYEMARSGYTREQVMDLMKNVIKVMRKSAQRAINNKTDEKIGNLYPIKATDMYRSIKDKTVPMAELGILNELNCVAIGILEVVEQERPEVVVACPTVGSVGIIPAAVVHLGDCIGKSDDEIAMAMFAAGCVGTFVAHQGSFSGEVAGCQAECGSAGAMAAAGVVEMMGGTAKQAFTASAVSLQNILGLICDPVSVGYEPCNARNAMAVSNALSTANIVLNGFSVQIPLDETIVTMNKVGEQLPPCLKGTYGGLACSPTGQKIAEICG